MKKTNWAILIVLILASIFLLWLWFFKGFNAVDNPVDIVVSIIWWIVCVLAVVAIKVTEDKRKRAVRTSYVGSAGVFNPEAGMVAVSASADKLNALADILESLKYNFDSKKLPDELAMSVDYVVRTDKFSDGGNTWKGSVVYTSVANSKPREFSSKEELASIIR